MDHDTRVDIRIVPLSLEVKYLANPQTYYFERAKTVRAERRDGLLTLYRHNDIVRINRHPAILGQGGRGGSFGNDNPLIPLEIDGEDHNEVAAVAGSDVRAETDRLPGTVGAPTGW